jgi:hypothetical protein
MVCFDFIYIFCQKHFSFWEELGEIWLEMYIGILVKYPPFLSLLLKLQFPPQIFEKYSNIIFHENPSTGSRVFPSDEQKWRSQ